MVRVIPISTCFHKFKLWYPLLSRAGLVPALYNDKHLYHINHFTKRNKVFVPLLRERVSGVEESKCLKVEESQEAEKDPTGDGRKGREHGSSGAGAKEQGT